MKHQSKVLLASAALVVMTSLPAIAADVNNGKALVEKNNCGSCHGADLKSPIAPAYPKIAGQHADYLFYALRSYQPSNSPLVGRNNAIMAGQVAQFKESELKDIAAYVSSLPTTLVMKK